MPVFRSLAWSALALPLSACSGCEEPPAPKEGVVTVDLDAGVAPGLVASSPVVRPARKTTSERIALGNLDGQIDELSRHLVSRPRDGGVRAELVSRLLTRARVLGRPDDLVRAAELGEAAPDAHGDGLDVWLLRARTRGAAHRFEEALADLDEAEKRKPSPGQLRPHRGALLAAVGRWDEALPLLAEEARLWPNAANLVAHGALLADMGRYDEADALFVQAETEYRDPSPFGLVSVLEARASAWERAGDLVKATALYREANARLPRHVHVATHFASLLPPSEGAALLAPLAGPGADPDLWGTLGALREVVEEGRGAEDLQKARAAFDEVTTKLPQAYADHAARFFLGVGNDPEKALRHALVNLAARKTPDAYELALGALDAAQSRDRACVLAAEAAGLRYPTPGLRERIRALGCPADAGAAPPAPASAAASATGAPSARTSP